jgi:hypothetical protein
MFSPLSIGTALGGFTSGFMDSQRQLQQRQAQQQAMQLNALRMKQAQQAQQAQSLAFPALLGLGGAGGGGTPQLPSGDAPPVPGGGGDTGPAPAGLDGGSQPPMPGASSQPSTGSGPKIGGASEASIIQRESGGKPNVGYGGADLSTAPLDQYGFPQWSGKMGPQGISHAAGLYQFEPATWREGAQAVGVHDFSADSQKKVYDYIHGKYGETPWAASAPGGSQTGEASPQQIAHNAQRQIPPQQWGSLTIQQLAQSIERANPGADPAVKMMALETASKLLAPMQQQQWEQYKFQAEQTQKERQFGIEEKRLDRTQANEDRRMGMEQRRLDDYETMMGARMAGGNRASKNIIVLDDKGKEVFRGAGHQTAQGWVNDADNAPIPVPQGGKIELSGSESGSGGRAGAQVLRQTVGGREVLSDLQNAVSMPIGSTTGILGQYHPGTSLTGALGGDVARQLTSQDAQLMQASFASLSRELSILMSPVYGGRWASEQIDPLIPKEGDSIGTALFKIARIKQSADNALEALSKSPIVSGEQKQFSTDMRQQLDEAVPWSTATAMSFARGGHADQSFADFMKTNPSGGAQPAQSSAPPTATNEKGEKVEWNGTEWVPAKTEPAK